MKTESTFLITHAAEDSAVLRDIESGRIHTLSENPGVREADVLSGVIAPEPPLKLTWTLVSVDERRSITIERSDESITTQTRERSEQETGEITRQERAGAGEVHIISVPPESTEQAIRDVLDDDSTLSRAARLGATRVELRSDGSEGIVSVRYLP